MTLYAVLAITWTLVLVLGYFAIRTTNRAYARSQS